MRAALLLLALAAAAPVAAGPRCANVAGATDGDPVDVSDVVLLLRWSVGLDAPSPAGLVQGDVAPAPIVDGARVPPIARPQGDGAIDVSDVVLALRRVVDLTRFRDCAPLPWCERFVPPFGAATGGTAVAIAGAQLGGIASVRFGSATAPFVHVADEWTLHAQTPVGTAGLATVTVRTADGLESTCPLAFEYR